MNVRTGCLTWMLVLLPLTAQAQTLTGSIEGSVGAGSSSSNGQAQQNNSFWQGYTLGYSSPLINPRLIRLNTEVSFRSGSLSFLGSGNDQKGKQRDIGYVFGVSLLPAGRFPFTIQATRDNIAESGNYPSSDGIRGGIVIPPGEPSPDFRTLNKALTMSWQLAVPSLPHVDVGYRKGSSTVTSGPYRGDQRDAELHVGGSKETTRTRQNLRYQRNVYESPLSTAYNQKFSDLGYDFAATLSRRLTANTRIGRRSQFSIFEVPYTGSGEGQDGAYRPPLRGQVNSTYAITTVSFQPWRRFALDMGGSFDRQQAAGVSTDARVATGAARLEVLRGLTLNAFGTYGDRGQIVENVPLNVMTRAGVAGLTYRTGGRWVQGSAGYSAGMGTNTTATGSTGATQSWAGNANLSVTVKGVGLSGGYDRSENRDDILDFGNYAIDRGQAALNAQVGRLMMNASAERARVDRGRGATYSTNLQRSFSGTVSLRLRRDTQVSANAGGFQNEGTYGNDHAAFAGVSLESQLAQSLHLSAWIRRGDMMASLTHLDQKTTYAFAQLEYRLRQFNLAVEYRNNQQNLLTSDLTEPYSFRGHQVLLRLSRKFGRHI